MAITLDGTSGITAPAIVSLTTPLSTANGGTGATSLSGAGIPTASSAVTWTAKQTFNGDRKSTRLNSSH